jgi:hypothetical protein
MASTRMVGTFLQKKSKKGPPWQDVEDDFYKIIYTNYAKDSWIDAAIDKSGNELVMKPNFSKTDWYHFHQAAKVHLAAVLGLVGELL